MDLKTEQLSFSKIKLHLANCLHLHSLPKSFTSLSHDAVTADARHFRSRKAAAVSTFCQAVLSSTICLLFRLPPPLVKKTKNKKTLSLWRLPFFPSLSACRFSSYQTTDFSGRPGLLFSLGSRWRSQGPGGVVSCYPDGGSGGGRVRARRAAPLSSLDPFIALSGQNLSALHDASPLLHLLLVWQRSPSGI